MLEEKGNNKRILSEAETKELDTLNSIIIDTEFNITKLKHLATPKSGREKAIAITKFEEALHRLKEVYNIDYRP